MIRYRLHYNWENIKFVKNYRNYFHYFIHNLVFLPTEYILLDKTGLLHNFASLTDKLFDELFEVIFNGFMEMSDMTFIVLSVEFSE